MIRIEKLPAHGYFRHASPRESDIIAVSKVEQRVMGLMMGVVKTILI